jgi:hypothetical protein
MGTDFKARQGWHICRKRTFEKFQAPSGAKSSEYPAPTGLEFCWVVVLQICCACGAARRAFKKRN